MLSTSRHVTATLLQLAVEAPPASSAPSWWEVVSGLLLAVAGMWATWAQFVYPKLAERRSKRDAATTPPPAPPAQQPTVDPVVLMIRDLQQLVDDLRDELAATHRQARRDAGAIARLTAELAACRASVTPPNREAPS